MKILLLTLLFLTACASSNTSTRNPNSTNSINEIGQQVLGTSYQGPFEINPEGYKRTKAKVYLPLQYDAKKSWPVIMLLHGFGGTIDIQDNYLTMRFRVSKKGFILVIPEGTPTPNGIKTPEGEDLSGKPFWNATDFCCDFGKTGVDDVTYLSRLLDEVKSRYSVDEKRVSLFGHSNGGFMANRLACEIGDKLNGMASLAGGSFKDGKLCRAPTPNKFLQIHALDDDRIPYTTHPEFAGGRETIDQWLTRNRCNAQSKKKNDVDYVFLIPGADTQEETWTNCKSGKKVALWTIKAHKAEKHNPHIPIFHLNFSDAVIDFLLRD